MAVGGDRDVLAELEEDGVHGLSALVDGGRHEERLQTLKERLSTRLFVREQVRRIGELARVVTGENRSVDAHGKRANVARRDPADLYRGVFTSRDAPLQCFVQRVYDSLQHFFLLACWLRSPAHQRPASTNE
jgi:hypothetical protein